MQWEKVLRLIIEETLNTFSRDIMSLCSNTCFECINDRSYLNTAQDIEIPVKNRERTDFKCFVFLISLFFFLVISVIVAGILYDSDSQGNFCDSISEPMDGILRSAKELTEHEFLEITQSCNYRRCQTVKECENRCKYGYVPFITPICYDDTERFKDSAIFLRLVYLHLSENWIEILILCSVSICLSVLILIALRMCPKVTAYILITIISIADIILLLIIWSVSSTNVGAPNRKSPSEISAQIYGHLIWFFLAIITSFFTAVFFYIACVAGIRLSLTAILFQEGAKSIKNIPMVLLQPLLTNLIIAVFLCFALGGLTYFNTSETPKIDEQGDVRFSGNIIYQVTSWILFFTFLWLVQFFQACQNLVIAGAVSSWYFARVKGKLVNPVWRSFCIVVKHHLGSAVFGSLILAIIKYILHLIKMTEYNAGNTAYEAAVWTVIRCLLLGIEAILKILIKSAFAMVVLFGAPFFISARRTFTCLKSDSGVIIAFGTFLLSAIRFMIPASLTFVRMVIDMYRRRKDPFFLFGMFQLTNFIVFTLTYLCTHCIFSVNEMIFDTLIICLYVDREINNGLENPYYMSVELKNLLIEEQQL